MPNPVLIVHYTTRTDKHGRVFLAPISCKKCTLLYIHTYTGQWTRYQEHRTMYNWSPCSFGKLSMQPQDASKKNDFLKTAESGGGGFHDPVGFKRFCLYSLCIPGIQRN